MDRKYGRIGVLLIVLILSGGALVAFLNNSFSAGTHGASAGAANYDGTIRLQSSMKNLNGTVESASTVTMTASTTLAAEYGASSSGLLALSSGASGSSSGPSTVLVNTGQQTGATPTAQSRPTANASRSIEFFTNVTLRVPSPSSALDKASAVAYSLGGYVAYSTLMNSTAFVVLRVPAQNYQSALSQVESLGSIMGATSTSNDVAVQYTDLNATLVSLTTEQGSLLKLLNQSTDINYTLKIESTLQQVNAQMNEVQSEILQTQRLINYGTISVNFEKVSVATPTKPLTIRLTATPRSGMSPLSVTFNAIVDGGSGSYIVNYNFGDGTSSEGQTLIHTFTQAGGYNVTVTVTDTTGNASEAWTTIRVSSPPVASNFGTFPGFVGGLFVQVVEGIIEVAVVILPLAAVVAVVVLPFRRRLGSRQKQDRAPQAAK